MAHNLIRRGNTWHCKVSIPRPLRQHFLGKAGNLREAIWEALGPDLTVAKPKSAARVAYWEGVFARLRAGETLDAIKANDERESALLHALTHPVIERPQDDLGLGKLIDSEGRELLRRALERLNAERAGQAATTAAVRSGTDETVAQAAQALYDALERDERRQATIDGHRLRVRAFVEACGDIPLPTITRQTASDFPASAFRTGRATPTPSPWRSWSRPRASGGASRVTTPSMARRPRP